jgi:hypothetical protein
MNSVENFIRQYASEGIHALAISGMRRDVREIESLMATSALYVGDIHSSSKNLAVVFRISRDGSGKIVRDTPELLEAEAGRMKFRHIENFLIGLSSLAFAKTGEALHHARKAVDMGHAAVQLAWKTLRECKSDEACLKWLQAAYCACCSVASGALVNTDEKAMKLAKTAKRYCRRHTLAA